MTLLEVSRFQNPMVELFLMVCGYYFLRTVLMGGAAALFVNSISSKIRQVYRIEIPKSQILSELRAALFILLFDSATGTVLIHFNLFRHSSGGIGVWLFTFLFTFVWYEIWFYFTHRLLHLRPLYFIHAQHHIARVTTPLTALSFSVMERLIFVSGGLILPVALSKILPFSFSAFAFYFVVNYALNLFGHLNVEPISPGWVQSRWGSVLNSPTYHALHHSRQLGHYGLFTPYLDLFFKSRFKDYFRLQSIAYGGEGLKT